MTYLVIAVQFLATFWFTAHLGFRVVDDKNFGQRVMWASLGVLIGLILSVVASAFGANSTALGINASVTTWAVAHVVGIATVVFLQIACRKVFKNLHQLT